MRDGGEERGGMRDGGCLLGGVARAGCARARARAIGIGHRVSGRHRRMVYRGTARSAPTHAPNSNVYDE
jgi:hypothetical protein